mmetsp:Transcript_42030/g.90796  ORF Transcript_42030/g.90796 Transcript_42030/m.90796 type:complete len:210 (-) Transcript_42030:613-1242(-)
MLLIRLQNPPLESQTLSANVKVHEGTVLWPQTDEEPRGRRRVLHAGASAVGEDCSIGPPFGGGAEVCAGSIDVSSGVDLDEPCFAGLRPEASSTRRSCATSGWGVTRIPSSSPQMWSRGRPSATDAKHVAWILAASHRGRGGTAQGGHTTLSCRATWNIAWCCPAGGHFAREVDGARAGALRRLRGGRGGGEGRGMLGGQLQCGGQSTC